MIEMYNQAATWGRVNAALRAPGDKMNRIPNKPKFRFVPVPGTGDAGYGQMPASPFTGKNFASKLSSRRR